ncbi:hypothetical protein [Halobacteriovorax sp. HLS]|uniref:hypothetical protein n=1 Tax=Halobacteriovorax sp. HLS TaxID=2234000 RepID=UPI000FD92870|nr:hypothetical protein [Halobacteriovorax sp. HLS]
MKLNQKQKSFLYTYLPSSLLLVFLFVGIYYLSVSVLNVETRYLSKWLPFANRLVIGFLGALLTSMALIITLTSNLYTPRLAKLFVHNPITILGMGFILVCNLTLILVNLFPETHLLYRGLLILGYVLTICAIGGIIPYLYFISLFIKPNYFLPLLQKQILDGLIYVKTVSNEEAVKNEVFYTFDVLANIAYTASKRDDKQLMFQVFDSIHEILSELMQNYDKESTQWRKSDAFFIQGISQEGRYHLEKEYTWPEAYILGRITKILSHLKPSHNEIIPFVCEKLLETIDEAIYHDRENIVEMHLMIFNTLFRTSLDNKDLERFQSMSYYYRISIELVEENPKMMSFATRSFIHYADVARKKNMPVALETVLFDIGRIILYFAYEDENVAINYINHYILKYFDKEYLKESSYSDVYYLAMVKTYWESKGKGFTQLAKTINSTLIANEEKHFNALKCLLLFDRTLHWEFNDRLLSFAYLSDNAREIAQKYYEKRQKAA